MKEDFVMLEKLYRKGVMILVLSRTHIRQSPWSRTLSQCVELQQPPEVPKLTVLISSSNCGWASAPLPRCAGTMAVEVGREFAGSFPSSSALSTLHWQRDIYPRVLPLYLLLPLRAKQ